MENQKLSLKAYEIMDGKDYPPLIPHQKTLPEFTIPALILGALIGSVFGAANAYLSLKVGLTVSASIPAAVMAVAAFRLLGRGSILETNMVQTIGSAGESLAAGVCFTIPALFLWNADPSQVQIILIAMLGGVLGVLFMIPLRKYLIVREHGKLPYPEGTACAEVLVAGQGDLGKAKSLFFGMGVGGLYQFLMSSEAFALWSKEPYYQFQKFRGALLSAEITPELLGVGYIVGPRIAAIMMAGGLLGWFVLIPLITLFGEHVSVAIYPETINPLAKMGPWEIWSRYIRYIGAGGVAFAGIFSLLKSVPVILESFREGIRGLRGGEGAQVIRTQKDLPLNLVLYASFAIAIVIGVFLGLTVLHSNWLVSFFTAFLVVLFSFFFVTVSSRIVGLLGSSSNPISGMTIATLILTCLLFILTGLAKIPDASIAVLVVGSFVCIAAAIAGDTSQDLKTGFLLGATPKTQQIGEIVGVISSALSMGFVMYLLKNGIMDGTLSAPQANLMKLVVDGVMGDSLPWALVLSGVFVSVFVELLGINSLAFAVGLYLPMSLSVPIMVGGLIRYFVDVKVEKGGSDEPRESGVLYSSGMIAGAALVGLCIAILVGARENSQTVESVQRFLKSPGITVASKDVRFFVNEKEVTSHYDFTSGSKSLKIEARKGDLIVSEIRTFSPMERVWVSVHDKKMEFEHERPNAIFYGVLAFSLLSLSLVFAIGKNP